MSETIKARAATVTGPGSADDPLDDTQQQLGAVRQTLIWFGFSPTDVEQPVKCILRLGTTRREEDWRDAFMAALAGGETPVGASSFADAAVDLLAARRLKAGDKAP